MTVQRLPSKDEYVLANNSKIADVESNVDRVSKKLDVLDEQMKELKSLVKTMEEEASSNER